MYMCIYNAGSEEQKQTYLEKIYSGEWTGFDVLTEPRRYGFGYHQNKAVPNEDSSYNITGTKIFITAGEHDLADNIIHLVLAKTPMPQQAQRDFIVYRTQIPCECGWLIGRT